MPNKIMLFKDDSGYLSNFYPCSIVLDGIGFPSVEHAFQAAKTRDWNIREKISVLRTPGEAKRFGRVIELRPDWEEAKLEVMESLVRYKFSNDWYQSAFSRQVMLNLLKETGGEIPFGECVWGRVRTTLARY